MTDVSAGFRPPCWCPSRWAPAWRLHTNLYKFGKNVSPHIFRKKNCCDLNLGESLCISIFFLFPDSELNLLDGFDFLFLSILNGVTLKPAIVRINKLEKKSSNIGKTPTTNQCRRVTDLWRPGSVKVKRYYTKNGRLIPTAKRGKEIKQPRN